MSKPNPGQPLRTKYLLASMAIRDTQLFFDLFGDADGGARLAQVWQRMGEEMEEEDRVAPDGLSAQAGTFGDGGVALLLGLPAPGRNHAHFLTAVVGSEGVRVFCLERSLSYPEQTECTVIAELALGHRANWGSGPDPHPQPDPEAFMAAVAAIVSGRRDGPLSMTPLPML